MAGKCLGIVGQDRGDSTSNQLHVDIFRFCIHSFEVHFMLTLFKFVTMFNEIDNVLWSISHIQFECEEYYAQYYQSHMALLWI